MWLCHRRQDFCDELPMPVESGVIAGFGFGGHGAGGVVGPGLRCAPGAGGGEVDAEGAGGAVGGQDFGEAVAKLGKSSCECVQASERRHACEVQGVAGGVEVAVEDCGVFTTEVERGWSQLKSARWWGG